MIRSANRPESGRACRIGLLLYAVATSAGAGPDEASAARALEAKPCGTGTIGGRLDDEIRGHSRRDLGWRMFVGTGYYDLERSLRVSKSMEMRFRWRVLDNGSVEPLSEPAQRLCA